MKYLFQNLLWKMNYDMSKIYHNEVSLDLLKKQLWPVTYDGLKLVRVGNQEKDGGYIIPDCHKDINLVFSPGTGDVADFELELAQNNCKIFMADKNVITQKKNVNFNIINKFIKSYNSRDTITFNDWYKNSIKDNNINDDILVQIDIEGDEYEVILSIEPSIFKKIKILIVEFHYFTRILQPPFNKIINSTMQKILNDFVPVHNHINNNSSIMKYGNSTIPHCFEITFLRKESNCKYFYQKNFPNNLDKPNLLNKKEILLPGDWYASKNDD